VASMHELCRFDSIYISSVANVKFFSLTEKIAQNNKRALEKRRNTTFIGQ
jgi:hypothetical protein